MRYCWEFHPNRAASSLHHTLDLPEVGYYGEPKGDEAARLKERLLAIPGVVEVSSHRYKVSVTRGLAFDWGPIHAAVLDAVLEFAAFTGEAPERLEDIPAPPPEPRRPYGFGLIGSCT